MNLFNKELIMSIAFNQEEILNAILQLYVGERFDVDVTYNKGGFYKRITPPL